MKAKFGTFLMVLGSALVLAALALFLYNQREQTQAAQMSADVMPQLVEAIRVNKEQPVRLPAEATSTKTEPGVPTETEPVIQTVQEMSTVEINGYTYIGFLGIPDLELELPVMKDWTYKRLNIAPCRFSGSIYTGDLVIMAHNYKRHFGEISELRTGASITFTDADGQTLYYEVVALDVLGPYDVEDMTSGEYDLTLFTCTFGGQNRVTVRCDRVGKNQV